ncbi:MAG: hypothetical protein AB1640_00430 [bacterium]
MMRKTGLAWIWVLGVLLAFVPRGALHAEVAIQELPTVLDGFFIGADINLFWRWDHYPYMGKSWFPAIQKDNNWGEIFSRIRFKAKKNFDWAETEVQIAPTFTATIDQDVYGVWKDDTDVDFNQAYIKFGQLFGSPLTVTVGMQDIQLEKQMLIGLGRTQDVSWWLLFNQSFPFGVRVDGDWGAVKTTSFWARSGTYFAQTFEGKEDVEVAGLNVHWDILENAYLYGGFFNKMDDTSPGATGFLGQSLAQTDTRAIDFGGDWTFGPFNIEAEAVYEFGGVEFVAGDDLDRKSFGFFVSPKFTLPITFSPYIKLHYIFWPGDENFGDDDIEEYDPMFEGWTVWNRWFIGEHMTEVFGLKTNTIKYIGEVGFYPVETCQVQAMYIRHQLDEDYYPNGALNPLTDGAGNVLEVSEDFADEINIFMNWQATDFLFVHSGIGCGIPNDGAQEIFGNKTAVFAQLWLMFAF